MAQPAIAAYWTTAQLRILTLERTFPPSLSASATRRTCLFSSSSFRLSTGQPRLGKFPLRIFLKKRDVLIWKTVNKFASLNMVIHPYGRVFWDFQKLSFLVSAVYDFFQITFLNFLLQISVSDFANFKNIYMYVCPLSIYKKRISYGIVYGPLRMYKSRSVILIYCLVEI